MSLGKFFKSLFGQNKKQNSKSNFHNEVQNNKAHSILEMPNPKHDNFKTSNNSNDYEFVIPKWIQLLNIFQSGMV